jgi:arylsulfotransferase ASST
MQNMMFESPRKRKMGIAMIVDRRPAAIGMLASTVLPLAAVLTLVAALWLVIIPRPASAATTAHEVYIPVEGSPVGSIAASPMPLTPSFSQSIHDYVLRCQAGINTFTLTMTAQQGVIRVAGKSGQTVSVSVSLAEGQAAVVEAPDPQRPLGQPTQYWIRCLPHDFPQLQVTGTGRPGWYLTGNNTPSTDHTSGTYAMILDEHGTPVWFHAQPAQGGVTNLERLYDETLAWVPNLGPDGLGTVPNGAYLLYDLQARRTSSFAAPIPPTDTHELLQFPNGHRLLFSSPLKSNVDLSILGPSFAAAHNTIVDCVVQEADTSGKLVWQWRASNHVALAESVMPSLDTVNGQKVANVYHCNSIDYDPVTQDVLVSLRNASAVYLLPPQGRGPIIWKLGGKNGSANPDHAPVISVVGDPETTFSGQHDARFQPDGGISMYDDHTGLPGDPRGVEYAIDAGVKTARFEVMFSSSGKTLAEGNFRRYEGGTVNLVCWGYKTGSGFTEFDASGQPLFDVKFPNGEIEYRAVMEPLSALDINLLRMTAGLN